MKKLRFRKICSPNNLIELFTNPVEHFDMTLENKSPPCQKQSITSLKPTYPDFAAFPPTNLEWDTQKCVPIAPQSRQNPIPDSKPRIAVANPHSQTTARPSTPNPRVPRSFLRPKGPVDGPPPPRGRVSRRAWPPRPRCRANPLWMDIEPRMKGRKPVEVATWHALFRH